MKRTNSINGGIVALVAIVLMSLQGCEGFLRVGNEFLEKPPSEDVTQDSVFSKALYARQFLNHTYQSLHVGYGVDPLSGSGYDAYGPNYTRLLGDNDPLAAITDLNQSYNSNNGGASVYYYTGSYNASVEADDAGLTKFNFYGGVWDGIRNAYIFLENIDQVPDMDTQTKKRLKAEARMIIATHYTRLFRNYGGMMWVDHAYGPNEDFQLARLTAKATLDSIVTVIDRAAADLPFALEQPSTEAGRFTQASAMGLKCRVLLFGASPLFNNNQPYMTGKAASRNLVWYGGYDASLWQQAADACGALIDKAEQTGAYYLADTGNPREDYQHGYYDRSSPELLISTRKRYQGTGGGNGMPNSIINEGVGCTTDNFVKMFPMADGTPIDQAGSGYDPAHPYQNRDPRLYETVLVNGVPYQDRTAELYIGGRERETKYFRKTRTGYREYKFALDLISAENHPLQWPYLRLSEIYLSYAEALNEVNGGPTAEAYRYVNKVRNRVDLGDLPMGLSQEEFRRAVIRERVLELGYEEVRWYDLVRWKMKDEFTKTLYGMHVCKKGVSPEGACKDEGYGYHESENYIYARYKLEDRYWKNNFSPKWYLSAFPRAELNKNYGLIQNPGW